MTTIHKVAVKNSWFREKRKGDNNQDPNPSHKKKPGKNQKEVDKRQIFSTMELAKRLKEKEMQLRCISNTIIRIFE